MYLLKVFFPIVRSDDIPEDILQQMRTCQTAANEFLRQFWSSVFPSPADGIPSGSANAAQKAAKAAKMAGYLTKTPEKVKAIVQTAHKSGLDATKIEVVRITCPSSTFVEYTVTRL